MNFTLKDIKKQFNQNSYSLGLIYAQRKYVKQVKRSGNLVRSEVRDPDNHNCYKQNIFVKSTTEGIKFQGTCSCPIVLNCHHVVAALLEVVQRNERKNMSKNLQATVPLMNWTQKFYETMHPDSPDAVNADSRAETLKRLIFVLTPDATDKRVSLGLCQATYQLDGTIASFSPINNAVSLLENDIGLLLGTEDEEYVRLFIALQANARTNVPEYVEPRGNIGYRILDFALSRNRLFWTNAPSDIARGLVFPLVNSEARPVHLVWQKSTATTKLNWEFEKSTARRNGSKAIDYILPTEPALYVVNLNCGEMVLKNASRYGSVHKIQELLVKLPLVRNTDQQMVSMLILEKGLEDIIPLPVPLQETQVRKIVPKPILYLGCKPYFYKESQTPVWFDYAQLKFDYDGQVVLYGSHLPIIRKKSDLTVERICRDEEAEKTYFEALLSYKFNTVQDAFSPLKHMPWALEQSDSSEWLHFSRNGLIALERAGWKIEKSPDYRYNLQEIQHWYALVNENTEGLAHDWFSLEIGIVVNKRHYALFPVFYTLIKEFPNSFKYKTMEAYHDSDVLLITLPDKTRVGLPWPLVRALLKILGELYYLDESQNLLELHRLDVARLAELDQELPLRWINGASLLDMGRKLLSFDGVKLVEPPKTLQANLRYYQQEGVSWMQFLREYGLAGILADDMGLGKTLQTLAHILLEKESERLKAPALIVVPTSLVSNWQNEAKRFTPSLRVLQLHGKDRAKYFEKIDTSDIVLTTYALLPRDEQELNQHNYHLLILDESQYIKNVRSKAAQIVSTLKAHHKLCLTGTPLENHLGELWSQFHFLLPGLLGTEKLFNTNFRYPIERSVDVTKQMLLNRRLRPFLLRRTKDKVAKELPMKTEIVRYVELSQSQQQVYEVVRELLDKKVQAEIEKYGIAHCQIIILEALLKLRQVCCDPRLLKETQYKQIGATSAKLTALLGMLDELLLENRHILVFSQFTSMLALIEEELINRDIPYAKLTGETVNRAEEIAKFQEGHVPVFLVSLKAGGVGLNLTAADTVIHYDPWWNPAVENQATDRAWRIGQEKPVFVYRLITKGTLEEKIQQLQSRKSKLANAMLVNGKVESVQITMDELKTIFQPIQAVGH